jgi:hypothetical protein
LLLRATKQASNSWSLLLFVGFRRQTPKNYSHREHEEPRNQMISVKVRAKLGYMLYQKRQAAKRY